MGGCLAVYRSCHKTVQNCVLYNYHGSSYHITQDSRGHQVTLALAPSGVKVQRGTIESGTFDW